ncbi:putative activator/secretion protein [Burkholderia sp. YI23]|nr:putative activator/secretion protein [Burkholderia sp. YI23]
MVSRCWQPNTAFLAATQLVGMRGGLPPTYIGASYDLFVGTPIYKPSGFPTSRVTLGFQMTAQL